MKYSKWAKKFIVQGQNWIILEQSIVRKVFLLIGEHIGTKNVTVRVFLSKNVIDSKLTRFE